MSQFDAEVCEIEGIKYEVHMLPPMDSHDLLMDVAKMVGPALGPVLDKLFGGGRSAGEVLDSELGTEFFTKAASALFSGLNKKVIADVIKAFRKVTFVNGMLLDNTFEAHFKGKLDCMYRWIAFGMKAQWGKSLSALVKAIPMQNQGANQE